MMSNKFRKNIYNYIQTPIITILDKIYLYRGAYLDLG